MTALENKIAIVTGAAHGIGRAIAEMFAEAGARVAVADIDVEAGSAVAAALSGAIFVRADVSVAADVEALVAALEPLMRNPESATAMGKGGRARVLEKFSLDAEANRIAEIYRTLV